MSGAPASKPAHLVSPGEPIRLLGPAPRFVSRGGEKLDAALSRFEVHVEGRRVLDAGASTGGFTDCLLQRGAASVVAVDVGHGQMHEKVRRDGRVDVHERTNVRSLGSTMPHLVVDLVVADLSFISLRTVAPMLVAAGRPGTDLVLLVKPQFEAGRAQASKGRGVVSDPLVWQSVLVAVGATISSLGAAIMGLMVSPLRGADGNVEFLLHAVVEDPLGATGQLPPFVQLVDVALAGLAEGT